MSDPEVFHKLVEKILYEPGFALAVLGSEDARKAKLDQFVQDKYPRLKGDALEAKQKAVLDSFNQVLAKTDLGMIEQLRQAVNIEPYPFLPL